MKNKKYLERKKAKKIRQEQYAVSLLGLDPGPIYFSPSEIEDFIGNLTKERENLVNYDLKEINHGQ